jgi:hypothetical protein
LQRSARERALESRTSGLFTAGAQEMQKGSGQWLVVRGQRFEWRRRKPHPPRTLRGAAEVPLFDGAFCLLWCCLSSVAPSGGGFVSAALRLSGLARLSPCGLFWWRTVIVTMVWAMALRPGGAGPLDRRARPSPHELWRRTRRGSSSGFARFDGMIMGAGWCPLPTVVICRLGRWERLRRCRNPSRGKHRECRNCLR